MHLLANLMAMWSPVIIGFVMNFVGKLVLVAKWKFEVV